MTKELFNLDFDEGTICNQGAFQSQSLWRNCSWPRSIVTLILMKELSTTTGLFNLDPNEGTILTKELSVTKGLFNLDLDERSMCNQGAFQTRSWRRNCLRPRGFSTSILTKEMSATKRAFQPRSWWKVIKRLFNLETRVVYDQGPFQHRSWQRNCLQLRGFLTSILTKELSATKGLFNLDLNKGIVCDQRGFSTSILTK